MKSLVFPVLFLIFAALIVRKSEATSYYEPEGDCPEGEIFYKCASDRCWSTCEHVKANVPCALRPEGPCDEPACLCGNGLVRNSHGQCVPPDQC